MKQRGALSVKRIRREVMEKTVFWLVPMLLVFQYTGSIWAQDQAEGKKLYATYCSSCHGENGKGDGPASQAFSVKPGDHTNGAIMNKDSDEFLSEIISKGGGAVGKSTFMPAWGNTLNEKQVSAVIAYRTHVT
jgi:mono/diheme cytochrome c family protein